MNRLHKVNIPIPELQKFKDSGPINSSSISLIYKNCKGCKPMYNILIEKRFIYVLQYQNEETDWNKIFELPFKSIKELKLQWLQFQILHRIIPTNNYLSLSLSSVLS